MFKHFGLDSTRHREEWRQSPGLLGDAISGQLSQFQVVCHLRKYLEKSLCRYVCIGDLIQDDYYKAVAQSTLS